ncbi:MAG: M3 family metallopeptidase, partial [Casimicrobiaceae bacterium]
MAATAGRHERRADARLHAPSRSAPRASTPSTRGQSAMTANPLLETWDAPGALPPFDRVRAEHFIPAFETALAAHDAEIAAIANDADQPSFDNTVAALDRTGRALSRIELLFWNLASSETSPALQAAELEMSPRLAAHHNATLLNAALFARIDALHGRRAELALGAEQAKLLERVHLDFVLAGARLAPAVKARLGEIVERLATLSTKFSQNVLADEAAYELVLKDEHDLAGLPDELRAAAHEAAIERGKQDAWMITLSRSLVVPFLTFSDRRDLREQAFLAWTQRGEHDGATDNRPIAREILALRFEQAQLHGYETYADFALVDRMAATPAAVAGLLDRVWAPAKRKALQERDALSALALSRGEKLEIEPWDWRYYAEKVRKARYDFD